ncbi:MAG TPA: nuclear transport factor 2 family protein [Solirubrobacterales bacterium]|nr:nuclear transport factor 2 family protein [Solirubrobacterales bacterium]
MTSSASSGSRSGAAAGPRGAPVSEGSNADLTRRLLAALSAQDADAFAELVDPQVEIHTQRGARVGRDEAKRWARRRFAHLERHYDVDEVRESGNKVVALVRVQYVWRESGKVGDEWLHGLALELRNGKLLRWRMYDDPIEALEELDDE